MNKAETKALIRLIYRLDVIMLAEHKPDVSAIHLIGRPADIEALSSFIELNNRRGHTLP